MRRWFDRTALAARNVLDEADEASALHDLSPGERLQQALELSDTTRALARSVGASWAVDPPYDLEEKARRTPVRVLSCPTQARAGAIRR